ncbi:hypothetical protein [Bradyrhizobium sp. STM 3809]|uniref:hypothetical protein n=1 Tax=Bradyrhizobium sp. STM 3809 TaxID=551936 RepID=UPI000554ECD0|nr:hypothetical protein [Bradyrhizobium sp. STM 3809]
MFEHLREAWHKATHPFEGFMESLWNIWKVNVGMAVLLARQSWQDIPQSIVQQGLALDAQVRANAQINQAVGLGLGQLGIPTSPGLGFAMNPDQALFIMTMARVGANRGDPPPTVGMEQFAEGVLRGQIDPVQALIACAPEFMRPQFHYTIQALQMTGMSQYLQIIRIAGLIQAAASIPRERIPSFLPGSTAAAGQTSTPPPLPRSATT